MGISEILVISMFVTLILLLFTGLPVAYVLAGVGVAFTLLGYLADQYLGTFTGLDFMILGLVVNRIYKLMDNWIMVALPMFIFMGHMLDRSGVAQRLMMSLQELFGRVHGGLAITVTSTGILLAASTGIIGASVVLLATMSLSTMRDQGYQTPLALGTIASAGTLGILLPPSIMLVMMADQVGLSVGELFMAALVPGTLLGGLYILYQLGLGWLKPDSMPLSGRTDLTTPTIIKNVLRDAVPVLLLIFLVLGSIFFGIATPTEASGVGAAGATAIALLCRQLNWKVTREVMRDTLRTSGYIFAIFMGATCFALVLRVLGGDDFIASLFTSLPFSDGGILITILVVVFLLGFVLDWVEITLIVLPLLAPIIAALSLSVNGYGALDQPELLWFIVLIAMVLQTSFLTPPVGFALFYLKGVCPPEVKLTDIYRGVTPFILLQLLGLIILISWPSLATWLPAHTYE